MRVVRPLPDHVLEAYRRVCERVTAEAAYLRLVGACPLVPIRDDAHYTAAANVRRSLADLDRVGELTRPEQEYLTVLGGLVEEYARSVHARPAAGTTGAAAVLRMMAANGWSRVELARRAGMATATLTAALNGSRRLTLGHAAKLAKVFGVPAEAILPIDGGDPRRGKKRLKPSQRRRNARAVAPRPAARPESPVAGDGRADRGCRTDPTPPAGGHT